MLPARLFASSECKAPLRVIVFLVESSLTFTSLRSACSSALWTESLYDTFVLLQPMPRAIVPTNVNPTNDNISRVLLVEVSESIDSPLLCGCDGPFPGPRRFVAPFRVATCRCYGYRDKPHHRSLTLEMLPGGCKLRTETRKKMDGPHQHTRSLWLHSTSSQRGPHTLECFSVPLSTIRRSV